MPYYKCDDTLIIADATDRLQLAIKSNDTLGIDRSPILINGDNTKSKTVSGKLTEDLIQIQTGMKMVLLFVM